MRSVRVVVGDMPLVARVVLIAAVVAGLLGAVAGLVTGLVVYPPTAGFAAIEIGLPAAIAGAALGLLIGAGILVGRRPGHRWH